LHASDYVSSGVPVIPTEAIGRRSIRDCVLPQVSEETATRLSRHSLKTGDVLFARRGVQATGLSAIATDRHAGALCGTGAIRLRLSCADIDPSFVSFWLSAARSIEWIKAQGNWLAGPSCTEAQILA
jgi:type I restriction enzyme S subunit